MSDQCEREMIKAILLNKLELNNIPTQQQFQNWVNTITKIIPEKIPHPWLEITIAVIDKKTSALLNNLYRKKKGPTNVLSFPYKTVPGIAVETLGDLAICAAIVEAEAAEQHKNLTAHWAHLTIHGTLHLLGYDHIPDDEADIMEALEIKIMHELDFNDPYQ